MGEDKKKIDFLCSWLYNMFADGLASHLKDQLTKQVKNYINYINLQYFCYAVFLWKLKK